MSVPYGKMWTDATSVNQLVELLTRKYNNYRKLRLCAIACARCLLAKNRKHDERLNILNVAELWADNFKKYAEQIGIYVARLQNEIYFPRTIKEIEVKLDNRIVDYSLQSGAYNALYYVIRSVPNRLLTRHNTVFNIIKDIFDNPFESFKPILSLSSTATSLAQTIYNEKDFTLMPILADRLEDEGITDEKILTHLRSNQLHVKGCHILDVILNKVKRWKSQAEEGV